MTYLWLGAAIILVAIVGIRIDLLSEKVQYWQDIALTAQNSVAAITAERDTLLSALAQRDKTIAEIKAVRSQASQKLQEVKQNDEQVRSWHDTSIPTPVVSLLNSRTANSEGNSAIVDDTNNPHALH